MEPPCEQAAERKIAAVMTRTDNILLFIISPCWFRLLRFIAE
jgi:hypothetical protein